MQKRKEFDFTAVSTFCTCERKYDYRINRGLVGKRPPVAADFGKAIHEALDSWFMDKDVDKAVEVFKSAFVEQEGETKRTHVMGEWILRNYHARYQDQPWEVVAVEKEFTLPLGDFYWIGRIDKIIRWNNTIWVVDHKTTSQLGPTYVKSAEPNAQFTGYVWAAREMGYNAVGIILDVILVAKGLLESSRRDKLTPLLRYDSYRSDASIEEWKQGTKEAHAKISLAEDSGIWLPSGQFNGSCVYYGECPYRKVCVEDAELRDRLIASEYEVNYWDPRNKGDKDAGTD